MKKKEALRLFGLTILINFSTYFIQNLIIGVRINETVLIITLVFSMIEAFTIDKFITNNLLR